LQSGQQTDGRQQIEREHEFTLTKNETAKITLEKKTNWRQHLLVVKSAVLKQQT